MVHILERESETEDIKEALTGYRNYEMQVSYNNWGHLMTRFFDQNEDGEIEDEFLMVFSSAESEEIIKFVKTHVEL